MNLPLSIGAKKITSVATVLSNIHSVLGLLKKQTPLKGAFDTISFNKSKQWLLYLNSDLVEYPSAKPTENVERLFHRTLYRMSPSLVFILSKIPSNLH